MPSAVRRAARPGRTPDAQNRKSDVGGRVFTTAMKLIEQSEIAGDDREEAVLQLSGSVLETSAVMLDGVDAFDRHLAWTLACRAETIDQLRVWTELTYTSTVDSTWDREFAARRVLVSCVASRLRIPERSTETLIAESEALVHDLPATMNALKAGEISYRHASALMDQVWSIPREAWASFEAAVLGSAKTLTVSKFKCKARAVRERMHPESMTARHVAAVANRCVEFQPEQDGMAWVGAHLPAPSALGVFNRVSDIAVGLQGPDESRTLTQLMADVFTDLLTDGVVVLGNEPADAVTADASASTAARSGASASDAPADAAAADGSAVDATPSHAPPSDPPVRRSSARRGMGSGVVARVVVTVPVLTLLSRSDEPGSLEGYGPIDPDTARRLAGGASSFMRILTHPETGTVLSVGRDRYKVPSDLRTWLRIRDETCRFPGCSRNASRCDLDHSRDWQFGGPSAHDNLAHLCPKHHAMKHNTAWSVAHARDGTLDWTSPLGQHTLTEPAVKISAFPHRAIPLPTVPPY